MSSSLKIVTYELYTLKRSGWVLHSRYPSADKESALQDAKDIEQGNEHATKLIKEIFNTEENTYSEVVVRISPNFVEIKKRLKQKKRSKYNGRAGPNNNYADNLAPNSNSQNAVQSGQVITGIAKMALIAFGVAAGITAVVSMLLRSEAFKQYVSQHALPQVLFVTFFCVFLLTALPLISRYIPDFSSNSSFLPDGFSIAMARKTKKTEKEERNDEAPAPLFQNDPGLMAPDTNKEAETESKTVTKTKDNDAKSEINSTTKIEPTIEPPQKQEPAQELEAELKTEAKKHTDNEDAEDIPSHVPDKQRMVMMRFLTAAITMLKDACPQLNTYNKFGLNLIMAGACSALGKKSGFSKLQIDLLTQESITMLGGTPALAANFCHKINTYKSDPRYAEMLLKGYKAFEDYSDQKGAPFDDVGNAMRSWNKPSSRISGAKIVTIMFTDIVGSTLITFRRGDQDAQKYVQKHNVIVRETLAKYDGEEIKHTGDGIMASFNNPSSAIKAAAVIQKAVRQHNIDLPDYAFKLRIGINTGEPIHEGDDLFGSAVQLASRICEKAIPGHIFIANVVKELISDMDYPLQELEPCALKGVKEAQILYDVNWKDFSDDHLGHHDAAFSELQEFTESQEKEAKKDEERPQPTPPEGSSATVPAAIDMTAIQVLNAAQQVSQDKNTKAREAATYIKNS